MRCLHKSIVIVFVTGLIATLQAASNDVSADSSSTKIFVNDVDVTGLTGQEFKNCTVKFDSDGNVHITAPGYKIKRLDSGDSGQSSTSSTTTITTKKGKGSLKKKYFLVTEENHGKKVWDKYSLIINGNVVKQFKSSDGVIVEDITKHIDKGTNQVVITASKTDDFPGGTKSNWYRILVGEGHEEDKKAVIDKTLTSFTRKGSDTDPGSKSFTLEAK